ncbi:hypothetical protein Tco_0838932 [Tanacetum coccineum]|uniref:Uncharacterized protein n=1 Tax=Tanacetum coccineum TaxID=301880 RepID=A0ABQ5AP77_9ASTR
MEIVIKSEFLKHFGNGEQLKGVFLMEESSTVSVVKEAVEQTMLTVDLGGSVITGIHGKPLGVLARELSVSLHKVGDRCPLYEPEGRPIGIKEVYYGCANDKSDGYGLILSLHKSTMSEDVGWKSYKCTGGIMAEEAIVGSNVYV